MTDPATDLATGPRLLEAGTGGCCQRLGRVLLHRARGQDNGVQAGGDQEPSRLIHVLEQSGWTLDRLDYLWIREGTDVAAAPPMATRGRVEAKLLFRRPIEDVPD